MRPIFAIFNFLRGLKTTKFHEVPAGTATKMYGEDSSGNLIKDDVPSGGGGASAFTELSDVPESYTDQAGKMLIVNEHEDGLEYIDLGTVITDSHAHANKDDLDHYDPDNFAASNHNHNLNDLTEKSYNSLTDKPTIPSGELEYFDEVRNTSTPNATVPAHQIIAKGAETNMDLVLSPKGNGAIIAQIPNNNYFGGDKRGINAKDFQTLRENSNQVASGSYSTISGGIYNKASGSYSTISGGHGNTATAEGTTVGGGLGNNATGIKSVISGGGNNTTSKYYGTIAGGNSNNTAAEYSFIGGGGNNTIGGNAPMASILGGYYAKASFYGQQSYASGRFATAGDSQKADYVLRGNTLTTNYYRLYLDGASVLIDLSTTGAYSTWQCKLKVTGLRRLTGAIDHYVSEHNFMIYRENGTPVIADFTEIHVHQVGASSVATGVYISTNSLAIDIATTESDWQFVAHLETVETFSGSLV